jgi:hypothetical protein
MQNNRLKIALIILAMMLGSAFVLILSELILMNSVPVMLSNNTKFNMIDSENEYLNYEGTWVIENEEHGTPLNSSNISCTKQTGKCIESRAYIFNNSLFVKTDTHQILSWDTNFIVFKNDFAICATYTYTIDVQKSELNGIKEIKNTEKEICSNGLAGKNLKLRLVDGYDVWIKERERKSFLYLNFLLIGAIFVIGFFKVFKINRN